MLIYIILALVFIFTYIGLPKWVQIILLIADIFIPDPLPYVDEIIMLAIILKGDD